MKKLDLQELKNFHFNTCVTLGFFDGVHVGHQLILKTLVNESKLNNYKSVVITFGDSVLEMFKMSKQITPIEETLKTIESLGVDYYIILNASDNFAGLSAKEFIDSYLEKINCKEIVSGTDLSFAKRKEGNLAYLKEHTSYKLTVVDDLYVNNNKISSTYIRSLLNDGKVKEANSYLYQPFHIKSSIIVGKQIGTRIGFKTANLLPTNSAFLLKHGVYFGYATIENKKYKTMVNVGYNPTVNDNTTLKVEAHILDVNEELYDKVIDVYFMYYEREEFKFESVDQLKERLQLDFKLLNEWDNEK